MWKGIGGPEDQVCGYARVAGPELPGRSTLMHRFPLDLGMTPESGPAHSGPGNPLGNSGPSAALGRVDAEVHYLAFM